MNSLRLLKKQLGHACIVDPNVGISLQCTLTKFELSTYFSVFKMLQVKFNNFSLTTPPQNVYWESAICNNFLNLISNWQPLRNFLEEKLF